MKKRKCMCMLFIFSSLCSCSRTLLPCCPLASFAKSTVKLLSGPVVASHVSPKKTGSKPSAQPRTSFLWYFQGYHRVPPQLHPRHRLRRIYLFHWNQQIREVTKELRETVARKLRETAAKVFPNGWRTSQRTSRSQKYPQPHIFPTTRIRNVL